MNIIKTNLSQKEPAMNAETVYRVDNAETVKIKHYALETLRRGDVLQRGAGGIIAACVGLVFATA